MNYLKRHTESYIFLGLILVAGILRLFNITHGQGIHPDERHMIMVAEKLSLQDMNPHSFAYGSFPYYLLWFSSRLASIFSADLVTYDGLFIVGRTLCALFGIAAVALLYQLSRSIYKDFLTSITAAGLLAFNVFHLQLSRFYTVDVILTTLALGLVLALIELYRNKDSASYVVVGFIFGLALATKVSALFLLAPIGTTVLLTLFFGDRSRPTLTILNACLLGVIAIVTFVMVQPYAVLDTQEFIKQVKEQTSMVQGLWRPPYIIQYADTTPYLYPLRNILLYTMGWPLALASGIGILVCIRRQFSRFNPEELIMLALIIPAFLVFGRYQVKFPRYLLPLYPASILFAAKFLVDFSRREIISSSSSFAPNYGPVPTLRLSELKFPSQALSALPILFAALALFSALVTIGLNSAATTFHSTLFMWCISITLGLCAAWRLSPTRLTWRELVPGVTVQEICLFCAALTLALFFRTYLLNELPAQLHNDEMSAGIFARKFLLPQTPALFGSGWLAHPNFGFFLTSLSMKIWGDNLLGLRASAVIFGMLSLCGGYLLVREILGRNIAFITLLLNIAFHFHLHFSRAGFHNMEATALVAWALATFVLAYNRQNLFIFGVSGVLFGLSLQTYPSALLIPIVITIWLGLRARNLSSAKCTLLGLAAFASLAFITYLPMLWHYMQAPGDFATRAIEVWIFAKSNAEHVRSVVGSNSIPQVLIYQVSHALQFFFPGTDTSLQYGFRSALYDPFMIVPALVGLIMAAVNFRQAGEQFLLIITITVYIGAGVLTLDPPFAPRFTPLAPLLMVFPAIFLEKLWASREDKLTNWALRALLGALIVGSVCWNLEYYFERYPNSMSAGRRDLIARLCSQLDDVKSVVNLFPTEEDFKYESYTFLSSDLKKVNLKLGDAPMEELNRELDSLEKPVLIIAPKTMRVLDLVASQIKTNRIGTSGDNPNNEFNWYVVP